MQEHEVKKSFLKKCINMGMSTKEARFAYGFSKVAMGFAPPAVQLPGDEPPQQPQQPQQLQQPMDTVAPIQDLTTSNGTNPAAPPMAPTTGLPASRLKETLMGLLQ